MRNVHLPHFSGVPRQRGRGLGALAGTIARTAFPILKRFVVPAAKKIGRDAIDIAIPQVEDVLSGKSSVKKAIRKTASSTLKNKLEEVIGKKLGGRKGKQKGSFLNERRENAVAKISLKKLKSNVCTHSCESLLIRCF